MPTHERIYLVLAAFFVGSLLIANIITFKLFSVPLPGDVTVFGQGAVVLAAGIIPYPVTFLVTDLISELYGKKRADAVVWTGFWVSLYILVILRIGAWVPPVGTDVRTAGEIQGLYVGVFGQSSRAIIASMIAYLVAQLIDVRVFHFWKRLTGGRYLWLRNNGSTMFSQLMDSVLVVTILFWGQLDGGTIIQIIIASYFFKVLVAALDTPLFYLGVHWLRPHVGDLPLDDHTPTPAPTGATVHGGGGATAGPGPDAGERTP
ncbi:MAG: queuosine precursor transporter [Longimicrobiales bacterium]|nr:queuosine precursor transporter [Longimicrobiales bacterium]